MKIINVTLTLFPWKGLEEAEDAAYKKELTGSISLGLLRIYTDEGIEGHAFLGSSVYSAEQDGASLIASLKPVLMGKDPLMRESLYKELISWQRLRNTTFRAVGAVDIALWDIAGKAAGMPIYRLIGGSREQIAAYASSQVLPDIETYVDEVKRYQDMNWKAYKIHPPVRDYREDIRICEAVREAAGDGYALMLDSMWAYSYPQAVTVGRELERLSYEWFEDPLPEHDLYNYSKLCEQLDISVMATEYPGGDLKSYTPWLMAKATDKLRGDVAVKGGITALIKAAALAEAFGMEYEIHHGANSLNNVANLHVALAVGNCSYFEVMLPDINQKYGMAEEIVVDEMGMVNAPEGSGLGMAIDMERILHDKTAVLE